MRSLLALLVLALAACQDSAPDAPVSAETPSTEETIPAPFRGVWDENADACDESFAMTRFTVTETGIRWFGGAGDVAAVRADGEEIVVDLAYVAEGSPSGEPEPVTTTLSLDDGRLSLGLGGGRDGLVRCGDADDALDAPPPTEGEDQTVAVRFSPGETSMTVSDTLRAFALHDYLVRASAGQRLTATARADGPGGPTVIVIREDTYSGSGGDFESVAPGERGPTDRGYEWSGALPSDGAYRVRVAHSGPSANGGTASPYTFTIGVE